MRQTGTEAPVQFHIENMTCGGCVRGVTRAIQSVDPGAEVTADLSTHKVEVASKAPRDQLVAALTNAGFDPA
jgi:copper chaperone